MNSTPLDLDGPSVYPALTTWQPVDNAGTWFFAPAPPPENSTTAQINEWLAHLVRASGMACPEIARVHSASWGSRDPAIRKAEFIEWAPGASRTDFLDQVCDAICRFPAPVGTVQLTLEVAAFADPSQPTAAPQAPFWMRLGDVLKIWPPIDGSAPYVAFTLRHTLFCPGSPFGQDNSPLHALNQPRLEGLLRALERTLGPISEFEGHGETHRYGFRPALQ